MKFGIYKEVEADSLVEALKKEPKGKIVKIIQIEEEEETPPVKLGF